MSNVKLENPFVLRGYVSDDYFCDRRQDTQDLIDELRNGNNVTLVAQRRIGKTGLIQRAFAQPELSGYYTFIVDIYATKSLADFVHELGRAIVAGLQSRGRAAIEAFVNSLRSLRSSVSFDSMGNPSWGVEVGEIVNPSLSLEEIFKYLESADKRCLVAIDEFQAISSYRDENVEAKLRTLVQSCRNANFVFSGSRRTMMSEMFLSHSRPFYNSTSIRGLNVIPKDVYVDFAMRFLEDRGISRSEVEALYDEFGGITWYLQRVLNKVYYMSSVAPGSKDDSLVSAAISRILDEGSYAFQSLLFQLPAKQKELLVAICREGSVSEVMSARFVREHKLASASSVQSALRGLVEKDFVTDDLGSYELTDKFLALWMRKNC